MKIAIRYYTRGGNTKKLADAISAAVGADAETTAMPLDEDVDILFLGSAVYAGNVDKEVEEFINGISVSVGKVVNFSSAAMGKSTYKKVEKLLTAKNIPLHEEEFFCRGAFAIFHKGRPNAEDRDAAAEFAKKIISQKEN